MPQLSPCFRLFAALSLGTAACAGAAAAQDGPFPFLNQQPTTPINDGDPAEALSRYLRVLGDRPNDVSALTGAARAALACGDPTSSIGFWARADKLQPNSAAIKAGLAAALVQAEQPKLALKLFDQASALGQPEAAIAADRGLARDLRGDNRAAQKDYQLALRDGSDPETVRRYALSLAMSGDRAAALAALDPLLRKQDMGAWRARAFVLALTGDTSGAVADAHKVLARQQADQIAPFLVRLASLTPAQQAAAVHFGDMPSGGNRPPVTTVDLARAADSVPVGPATQVALAQRSVAPAGGVPASSPRPSGAVDFAGRPLVRGASLPSTTSTPGIVAPSTTSTLNSAALAASRSVAPQVRPVPATSLTFVQRAPTTPVATQIARAEPLPSAQQVSVASRAQVPATTTTPRISPEVRAAPVSPPAAEPRLALASVADMPVTAPRVTAAPTASAGAQPGPPEAVATVPTSDTLGAEALADGARLPATTPPAVPTQATRGPVVDHVEPAPVPAATPTRSTPPETREPQARLAGVATKSAGDVAGARSGSTTPVARHDADEGAPAKAKGARATVPAEVEAPAPSSRKSKAQALADAKAAAAKVAADKQAKADKLAADKQAKADKLAKAQERAAPSRIWVQVAGGANRNDLGKAWDKLKKSAPDLYAGQKPSTTPLRFTNRLLVGPFKSEDDAQAYVNRLTKGGQSGFMFKSSGGQKVEAVGAK